MTKGPLPRKSDFELASVLWHYHLLFSGASGNWTRDRWKAAEAEVFAKRAMAAGVPREAILLEPRATHIGENLSFSRERLRAEKVSIERVKVRPAALPFSWQFLGAWPRLPQGPGWTKNRP